MALATKTFRVLQVPVTNPVGGSTTSATWDLSTALGAVVQARVTNGAVALTAGCECVVQISGDGAGWYEYTRQVAGTAINTVYDFAVELPAPLMRARVVFSGNAGQAVTVEASGHELTAIG
jgi:hypothetical protein